MSHIPRQRLLAAAIASAFGASLALVPTGALAQAAAAEAPAKVFDLDIPAQPLSAALNALSRQAGIQVLAAGDVTSGVVSRPVHGRLTADQALSTMLAQTPLQAVRTAADGYAIRRGDGAPAAEAALPPVSVTARAERSANTEFSRSYTSDRVTIGKGEQSIRQVPQSVSVVTRQRLDDQNLTSLADAMKQTTGITAVPYGNGVIDFTARGYDIDQYQFDGLSATGAIGAYSTSSFDTAIFDRIEVLRGPAGMLQGSGEPSGTINMVRKRALKDFTVGGALSVGSWNTYRGEIDVTGSLAQEGRLRGRFVAAYDDRDSYLDYVYGYRSTLYGTLEYDFTAATTLSVGAVYQGGESMPNFGLPVLADGRLFEVSRATFLGDPWNQQRESTTRYFVDLQHRLEKGGELRIAASAIDRDSRRKTSAFGLSAADAAGNLNFRQADVHAIQENKSIDAYASLPWEAFGLTHNLLVGVAHNVFAQDNTTFWSANVTRNVYEPTVTTVEPAWTIPRARFKPELSESAAYGQLRMKALDELTFIAGGRASWWTFRNHAGATGDFEKNKFIPYAGVIYDVTRTASIYGSYSDVFKVQTGALRSGGIVEPREGAQYEVGVKSEWLEGRLNGHLALFQIKEKNRETADPVDSDFYVTTGKTRSRGLEAELSGRVQPYWDLTAGYAYTETNIESRTGQPAGLASSPGTPRHSLKLWTKYRFARESLPDWSTGFGLNAYSKVYAEDGDAGTRWEQGGYIVAFAQVGYKINRNLDLSLNVNNLFDKTYFARIETGGRQNYFGDPRNFMLTLRGRY